ncbi:hypothetical protein BCY91_17170 [Pelobium manganitolerans]|uniref:Uncharacterized protein n=1 Tax=Pelobium manganitolerans TaxID=1842495 RepID=A0A419S6C8_9SPHI|nr:hypothetical protein [Pelobium manganitolerans]RKD16585.1 hypothetical protein BCY91_17170 [Pelobium manganitolerans]
MPDYRTTLFWSPSQQAGQDGNSQLSFYTSDQEGLYQINIQAMSNNGELGSATAFLKVSKKQ